MARIASPATGSSSPCPRSSIGFFPDIGATWFLPRLPGELGTYCALTGERLDAADGVAAGIATHRVASARFPELVEALCSAVSVDALLGAFAQPAGEGPVRRRRPAIDRLFTGDRIEDILAALDAEASQRMERTPLSPPPRAALMRTKSPTSLKIVLAQMRRGPTLDFTQCMRTEFRIVSRVVRGHDLYEGIRAVIIDKDQAPRWQPATLEAVSAAEVERYFAPLASELELPMSRREPYMSKTDQPQTLEPVQADEGEAEVKQWAYWLVVFLRVMAAVSLFKGLYHWAIVCGIDGAVPVRLRLLSDAVSGRDRVLRGDRSGRGSRAVAGRALGRGGVAHIGHLHGGGRVAVSADLRRKLLGDRGGGAAARHVSRRSH